MKNKLLALLAILTSSCYSGDNMNDKLDAERLEAYTIAAKSDLKISEEGVIKINPQSTNPILGRASEIFFNRSYIELKTPEDIIIGTITKMRAFGDFILVLDQTIAKAVFLFNTKGEYQFTVGVRGGGPGEHDEPIDIAINNDKIFITDQRFNIYEYDLNNQFIKKQSLPFFSHSMHVFDDNSLAFTNNETNNSDLSYQIMMIQDQEISKRIIQNKGAAISLYSSNPISHNPGVHRDSFLFSYPWGTDIYQVYPNKVKLRFKILTETPIPEKLIETPERFRREEFNYTYTFNSPVLETTDIALFRLVDRQRVISLIYDKHKNSIRSYNGLADNLLYGGISDYPIHVNGKDFYIPLEVEQMYIAKQEILASSKELRTELKEARPEFFSLIENLTETSNPILMKCEIQ